MVGPDAQGGWEQRPATGEEKSRGVHFHDDDDDFWEESLYIYIYTYNANIGLINCPPPQGR